MSPPRKSIIARPTARPAARGRHSARDRGSVYLFVLAVVGMATAAALVALASTDGLVAQAFTLEDSAKAETQTVTAQELALQRLNDPDDDTNPLVTYRTGNIVEYKANGESTLAWLTDFNGDPVTQSGSTGIRLWSEGVRRDARALRSVDLVFSAPLNEAGEEQVFKEEAVAYWPLSAVAGTFARDLVGSSHGEFLGGVDVGGTAGPGAQPATVLDGVDGRIMIPHEDWMLFTEWSISLWFRIDETPNRDQTIVSKDAESGDRQFEILYTAEGTLVFIEDGLSNRIESAKGLVTKGVWYHLALTVKSDKTRLYLNGDKIGETNLTTALVNGARRNVEPIVIGAGQHRALTGTGGPVNNALIGAIAEVSLFDDDLSSGDVDDLYKATTLEGASLRTIPGTAARRAD